MNLKISQLLLGVAEEPERIAPRRRKTTLRTLILWKENSKTKKIENGC
jgi:hypothetical protein